MHLDEPEEQPANGKEISPGPWRLSLCLERREGPEPQEAPAIQRRSFFSRAESHPHPVPPRCDAAGEGRRRLWQSTWNRSLGSSRWGLVRRIEVEPRRSPRSCFAVDVTVRVDAVGLVMENDFYDFR